MGAFCEPVLSLGGVSEGSEVRRPNSGSIRLRLPSFLFRSRMVAVPCFPQQLPAATTVVFSRNACWMRAQAPVGLKLTAQTGHPGGGVGEGEL